MTVKEEIAVLMEAIEDAKDAQDDPAYAAVAILATVEVGSFIQECKRQIERLKA